MLGSVPRVVLVVTLITVSRLALIVPVIGLLLARTAMPLLWALVVLNVLELTDIADGLVARRDGTVSDLGKLLDPLVDSLTHFALFATFVVMGLVPVWLLVVLFFRDMLVAYMRSLAASRGMVVMARWSGKTKTAVQVAGGLLVTLALVAEAGRTGAPEDLAAWSGPPLAGVLASVGFLAAMRLWDPIFLVVALAGAAQCGYLYWVWAARPAIPAGDVASWVAYVVAAVTVLSLADYAWAVREPLIAAFERRER
jgi:CDP-diacylglycerol--glycerol-3-phosphate 3-phosphatidyltransferase